MKVIMETIDKSLIIHFFGELDHHYAQEIRDKIDAKCANGTRSCAICTASGEDLCIWRNFIRFSF